MKCILRTLVFDSTVVTGMFFLLQYLQNIRKVNWNVVRYKKFYIPLFGLKIILLHIKKEWNTSTSLTPEVHFPTIIKRKLIWITNTFYLFFKEENLNVHASNFKSFVAVSLMNISCSTHGGNFLFCLSSQIFYIFITT